MKKKLKDRQLAIQAEICVEFLEDTARAFDEDKEESSNPFRECARVMKELLALAMLGGKPN